MVQVTNCPKGGPAFTGRKRKRPTLRSALPHSADSTRSLEFAVTFETVPSPVISKQTTLGGWLLLGGCPLPHTKDSLIQNRTTVKKTWLPQSSLPHPTPNIPPKKSVSIPGTCVVRLRSLGSSSVCCSLPGAHESKIDIKTQCRNSCRADVAREGFGCEAAQHAVRALSSGYVGSPSERAGD